MILFPAHSIFGEGKAQRILRRRLVCGQKTQRRTGCRAWSVVFGSSRLHTQCPANGTGALSTANSLRLSSQRLQRPGHPRGTGISFEPTQAPGTSTIHRRTKGPGMISTSYLFAINLLVVLVMMTALWPYAVWKKSQFGGSLLGTGLCAGSLDQSQAGPRV